MKNWTIFAARDGDTITLTFPAMGEEAATHQAIDRICEAFRLDRARYVRLAAEGLVGEPDADDVLNELRADLDGCDLEIDNRITAAAATVYRRLADGLSDMIENGRLSEGDIPDDYRWLVEHLAEIAAVDPAWNGAAKIDEIRAEGERLRAEHEAA